MTDHGSIGTMASAPVPARAQISMLGKKLGTKIDASRTEKGAPLTCRLPAA